MKIGKLPNRQRNFEALEPRNLLAGNVTADATTVPGTLVIQGDNSANVITLTQTASGQIKVTGSGTKVNGSNSAQSFTVTNGIYIDMGGGSDVLTIKNLTVPGADLTYDAGLDILMGTGNDVLVMSQVTVDDGYCAIDTGDGNDATTVDRGEFEHSFYIDGGNGTNAIAISRSAFAGQFGILGGTGNDAIALVNDTFTNDDPVLTSEAPVDPVTEIDNVYNVLVNDFSVVPAELNGTFIDTGSGADALVITGAKFDGLTQIDTESGNDAVAISNSRFGEVPEAAPLVQPAQTDDNGISGLCVETGTGSDAVSIVTTTVYGFLQVDTSGQVCCPVERMLSNAVQPAEETTGKDGNDAVAMVKVNVFASAMMAECSAENADTTDPDLSGWCSQCVRAECGELLIYTGNQIDAVALNSVNTDCKALIQTTDLDDSSLDGADAVAIVNCKFNQNAVVMEWFAATYGYGSTGLEICTGRGNDAVSIVKVNVNGKTTIDTGDGTDAVAIAFLNTDLLCVRMGGGSHDALTVSNTTATDEVFDGGDGSGDVLVYKHLNNHFANDPNISGFETVV